VSGATSEVNTADSSPADGQAAGTDTSAAGVGVSGAESAAANTSVADDEDALGARDTIASEPTETAVQRPTVGVVYEPDESPDGFPLEYGNIIVGLPKSPPPSEAPAHSAAPDQAEADPAPTSVDTPSTETAESTDQPTAQETDEESTQPTGQADDAVSEDEPAPTGAQADEPAPADNESAEAEGEPAEAASGEAGPAESAEDSTDESADNSGETEGVEPALAESNEASGENASGESAGAAAEGSGERASDESAEFPAESSGETIQGGTADSAAEGSGAGVPGASADVVAEGSGERASDESGDFAAESSGETIRGGSAESAAEDPGEAASGEGAEAAGEGSGKDGPADGGEADLSESDVVSASSETEAGPEQDEAATEQDEAATEQDESATEQDGAASEPDGAAAGQGEGASAEGEGAVEAGEGAAESGEGAGEQTADGEADGAGDAEGDGEPAEELTAEQAAEKVAAEQAAMALITALMRLRGALAASQLPIDVVGADEARQQQKAMLDQLDDYILPRLVQLEAPVLAVVGGSTGAGKSTLVNTIIGKVVSEPGVLRPTTRSPVLIHHPADAEWFVGDRVLPGMARSSGDSPGGMEDAGHLRLVAADTIPQGLAILDAPDIDSVVEANRDLATQLLAAADLWLFVTTAARYSDAVPWDFLQSASDRSTAVAVVLDRAPEDTIDDITGHLAQMLLERGLGDSPLFSIKETVVDSNGMLPAETVASIKDWLIDLAADAEARSAVVRRTLHGAVTAMVKKAPPFVAAVRAQGDTATELRSTAETAYDQAVKDIAKATQDGTLLRGEVLARWQEFVGTGELLKGLQTNVGRLRDKVKNAVVAKPPPTRDLNDAVESGLESLLREHAEAAAERAEQSWQSTAAGRQLLTAADRELGRMSEDFPAAAGRVVRDWQGFVLDLIRKEGADKRSTARILEYGVNGLGLSLIVAIFASTAEVSDAEAGTAVVGQKLLEAVFGDQAVPTLVAKAREDLGGRVHALMNAEFARYLAVLDQHPVDPDAARQLTEAARAVEDCT